MCTIKYLFTFFVELFLASGVALIIIGALQYSAYSHIGYFGGNILTKISIVIIAVGITICIVSILGFIGAFNNNAAAVAGFICILIVIIFLEVFTGVAFYVFHQKGIFLNLSHDINVKTRHAFHHGHKQDLEAMERIQNKFKCCGADKFSDWDNIVSWKQSKAVPDSCCKVKSNGCGRYQHNISLESCILAIEDFLSKNQFWVGGVCIGSGIAKVLGIFVGVCFWMNIKGKSYENLS